MIFAEPNLGTRIRVDAFASIARQSKSVRTYICSMITWQVLSKDDVPPPSFPEEFVQSSHPIFSLRWMIYAPGAPRVLESFVPFGLAKRQLHGAFGQ